MQEMWMLWHFHYLQVFILWSSDAVLAGYWTITEIHGSSNQSRNCKHWIWKAKCFHGKSVVCAIMTKLSGYRIYASYHILVQYMVGLLLSEARMFTLWPTQVLLEFNVEWMEINSTPSDICCCNCTVHLLVLTITYTIVLWSVSPYRQ